MDRSFSFYIDWRGAMKYIFLVFCFEFAVIALNIAIIDTSLNYANVEPRWVTLDKERSILWANIQKILNTFITTLTQLK